MGTKPTKQRVERFLSVGERFICQVNGLLCLHAGRIQIDKHFVGVLKEFIGVGKWLEPTTANLKVDGSKRFLYFSTKCPRND